MLLAIGSVFEVNKFRQSFKNLNFRLDRRIERKVRIMKIIHNHKLKKLLAMLLVCILISGILLSQDISAQQDAARLPGYGLSNPVWNGSVSTWDCIYFGHYWQNDTNKDGTPNKEDEKEPIKWRVLSVDGDDVFLLSDQNLICRPYKSLTSDDRYGVTWETSTIRSWLNGYDDSCNICDEDYTDNNFISDAFNEAEQAAIADTTVAVNDNPSVYPANGNDTVDKIFLLSTTEIGKEAYGFEPTWNKTKTRVTTNTAFANTGNTRWMLRTMGEITPTFERVCCIDAEGRLWTVGGDAPTPSELGCMIRPALHLNLSSLNSNSNLVWSYAGKITSNGEEIEAELPKPGLPTSSPTAETPEPTATTETPSAQTPPAVTTPPEDDDGPIEITKISLPVSYTKLRVGDTYQIEADIIPANATDKTLTYESSDTSVVSVSETGQIETIKEGTATVILKSANGKNTGLLVTVEGTKEPPEKTTPPAETTPPVETTSPAETTPPTENTPPAEKPSVEVTGVSLPVASTTLHIGDTYQIKATVVPANATDKTLTFESSDTSVASVSGTGEIQAKKPGTATVIVTSSNGKTAKLQVRVETKTIDVEKVIASTKKITMGVGEKIQLEASVHPQNASNKVLTYKTSNNKVTVNMFGKITAKKTGSCQITVSSSNNKKAVVTVTVKKKPGRINLNQKSKTLKVGKQFQIKPKLPKGTASYQITYTSKKKSVAAVSQTGKVIAKKKGTTVITVRTYNGKKATIRIRVK